MADVNIIFAVICWLCSVIFTTFSLCALKRNDPMHFWAGSTVKAKEIKDIPAYNRANSLMWGIYSLCLAAIGILALFFIKLAVILLIIICIPGLIVLIFVYQYIYNKYKTN